MDLEGEDELVWTGDSSGFFSVKGMIEVKNRCVNEVAAPQPLVWNCLAPPRVQLCVWCCLKKKILTRADMRRRGISGDDGDISCPLCGSADETIDHLLVSSPLSWKLWSYFLDLMGVSWVSSGSLEGLTGSWFIPNCNRRKK